MIVRLIQLTQNGGEHRDEKLRHAGDTMSFAHRSFGYCYGYSLLQLLIFSLGKISR